MLHESHIFTFIFEDSKKRTEISITLLVYDCCLLACCVRSIVAFRRAASRCAATSLTYLSQTVSTAPSSFLDEQLAFLIEVKHLVRSFVRSSLGKISVCQHTLSTCLVEARAELCVLDSIWRGRSSVRLGHVASTKYQNNYSISAPFQMSP